jgi:hypothetical protein
MAINAEAAAGLGATGARELGLSEHIQIKLLIEHGQVALCRGRQKLGSERGQDALIAGAA